MSNILLILNKRLKVCDKYGIETVFMDANLNNPTSWKTMESLGGAGGAYDDVKKSLSKHKNLEEYVSLNNKSKFKRTVFRKLQVTIL